MNIKKIIARAALVAMILLSFCNISLAENEIDANTILNAFIELKLINNYPDQEIEDRLEKIVDRKENFSGKKWDELQIRLNNDKQKGIITRKQYFPLLLGIYTVIEQASRCLVSIADKKFLNIVVNEQKTPDGKSHIVSLNGLEAPKRYLKYSIEVLETGYEIFKDDPEAEEFIKLIAAEVRKVDLFDKMQDAYIEYVKSLGSLEADYKDKLNKYKEAKYNYETEFYKLTIYQHRKIHDLSKRNSFIVNGKSTTDDLAKELERLEKKYEKIH